MAIIIENKTLIDNRSFEEVSSKYKNTKESSIDAVSKLEKELASANKKIELQDQKLRELKAVISDLESRNESIAHSRGYEEGKLKAESDYNLMKERLELDFAQEKSKVLNSFYSITENIDAKVDCYLKEKLSELTDIIYLVVNKIFYNAFLSDRDRVQGMLSTLIESYRSSEVLIIYLSVADFGRVTSDLSKDNIPEGWELVIDECLKEGDIRVKNSNSLVDYTISKQIENLKSVLDERKING